MKNYLLPLFFSFLFYQLSFSQFNIANYPIDQFKLPDIDRQALEFSGNFFGDFVSKSREGSDHYVSSQINSGANLLYSRYINRPDLQALYAISLFPGFDTRSTDNEFTGEHSNITSFDPFINYSAQRFNYRDQHFTLTGVNGFTRYDHDFRKISTAADEGKSRSHSFEFDVEFPLGIGTGRIETISDMAMALFLLNDAIQAGTDPTLVSQENVNAFASRMVTLRNERVFDSRAKRVHELRELYRFMQENHWTVADDPGFFTVLTDNWLYNVNPVRFAGRRWTYGFTPSYNYFSSSFVSNGTPSGNAHRHQFGGEFSIDFQKYKPKNVHHDFIRSHGISLGITRSVNVSELSQATTNVFIGGFTTSIGQQWLPNSRTRVTATLSGEYNYVNQFAKDGFSRVDHVVDLSLISTADYFISYRTRLFASFNVSYDYKKNGFFSLIPSDPNTFERINTGFNIRLSAGVAVSIF